MIDLNWFKIYSYEKEAEYVLRVAEWHEASDGRGIGQLARSRSNYKMLNYILDEWMPWYKTSYDFTYVDINRYIFIIILSYANVKYLK